jgi:RNA polymerase sigma factor (sigma-70 family)
VSGTVIAEAFEAERARLVAIAARVLGDAAEAEDMVQQAWLRLDGTKAEIENLPAWLTTVTTRLCLDRLRARVPVPADDETGRGTSPDPLADVVLSDSVGAALHVVLDRLTPDERVSFVLHDSFGVEFSTIADILATTPPAARKLASRARAKVDVSGPPDAWSGVADRDVVDAFMRAARAGEFEHLLRLLAPEALVSADRAAVVLGTPERLRGASDVARFFDGSAHAALPVTSDGGPGYAWFDRGAARVLFDFDVRDGLVQAITFRADPVVLAGVRRRPVTRAAPDPSDR